MIVGRSEARTWRYKTDATRESGDFERGRVRDTRASLRQTRARVRGERDERGGTRHARSEYSPIGPGPDVSPDDTLARNRGIQREKENAGPTGRAGALARDGVG